MMTTESIFQYIRRADATSIHHINATNDTSMNYEENFIHKYYEPFYQQRTTKMYLMDQGKIQKNQHFFAIKAFILI